MRSRRPVDRTSLARFPPLPRFSSLLLPTPRPPCFLVIACLPPHSVASRRRLLTPSLHSPAVIYTPSTLPPSSPQRAPDHCSPPPPSSRSPRSLSPCFLYFPFPPRHYFRSALRPSRPRSVFHVLVPSSTSPLRPALPSSSALPPPFSLTLPITSRPLSSTSPHPSFPYRPIPPAPSTQSTALLLTPSSLSLPPSPSPPRSTSLLFSPLLLPVLSCSLSSPRP
ncbi:hypothetical protein DFH09DRAFT_1306027 [Mycena vulgaris]|nr:hypothetical protein DFH09DRAFT_1306027 [Mycena vulgaris]